MMEPLVIIDSTQMWLQAHPGAQWLGRTIGPHLIVAGYRKLKKRISHDTEAAKEAATENALAYTKRLGEVIEKSIKDGHLTKVAVERAIASPSISRVLEQAFLTASLTDDRSIVDELAQLVSARLASEDGSQIALRLNEACGMLEALNGSHLRTMAAVYFAKKCQPSESPDVINDTRIGEYVLWIKARALALGEPVSSTNDMIYLESLGLVRPVRDRVENYYLNRMLET